MRTDTKKEYENWMNELDVPFDDCQSNGGRIPDHAKWGTWVRRNDPVAFQVGYNEWSAENREVAANSRRVDKIMARCEAR